MGGGGCRAATMGEPHLEHKLVEPDGDRSD